MSATRLPTLYGFWRSSAAWRVRTALKIKKIDYEYKPIDLFNGAHKTEAYKAVMPLQLVPSLVIPSNSEFNKSDQNITLHESLAIIEFLEEVKPHPRLLPMDPALKAAARAQALVIAADIQPLGQVRVVEHVEKVLKGNKQEWIQTWIQKGFDGLEKMVAHTTGKYCVGDEVTVADLCLVPQVFNAKLWGVDMTKYPNLNRIDAALAELDEFKAAHATAQPDAPKQ